MLYILFSKDKNLLSSHTHRDTSLDATLYLLFYNKKASCANFCSQTHDQLYIKKLLEKLQFWRVYNYVYVYVCVCVCGGGGVGVWVGV